MKKNLRSFSLSYNPICAGKTLFSLFCFFVVLLNTAMAQSASATWALSSSTTTSVSITGNLSGASEAIGAYFPAPAYNSRTVSTGGTLSSQTISVNPNSTGTSSATAHASGGYVQFAVSPQTASSFTVSSLSFYMGSGNANSVSTSVEYSLNSDFSSPVILGTPSGAASFPTTNYLYPFSFSPASLTLTSGQTLYVRVYAWHGSTTVRYLLLGNVVISGTTATSAPVVTTTAISNLTATSATTGGNVVNDAGNTVTERGVVYSTSANPTTADTKLVDAGSGTGSFNTTLSNLTPATTYHVRAYAISGAGTGYGNDVSFYTPAPDPNSVTVQDNGTTVILANNLVRATISKSTATVTSLVYNGLELISGGYNGGQIYWSWNMPNYQNPSGCAYTLTADPHNNNFDYAEIKLHMTWNGSASTAAMDVDVYYSLPRNASGLYASATLSHPAAYPALPGGEWRMASYPNPRFDWMSVDSLRNKVIASGDDWGNAVAVPGAPAEVMRLTTGPFKDQYECKYDYSADFGAIDTWGWSSTADNVGLWVTAPSKEYYPGGPMKRELMCHSTPVLLNMLGGTHYGTGDETNVAAGEDWQKTYGPFLLYCNKVAAGTPNAAKALWEDAKAQAKTEQAAWPYTWYTNPAFVQESGRGTVTGKLVINESGNSSAADMWVGLTIPQTGYSNVGDFQHWTKNYQFWVKTDASGNFTLAHVLPGTYHLYAFGPSAAGQLVLTNAATVTAGNTTALGTVTWTPARTASTLWEIGTPDRTAMEFKHGNDWWTSNIYPDPNWAKFMDYTKEFPGDVNFTIGKSNIATDWNFVQPYDKNVQSTSPNWKVNFNLTNAPTAGSTAAVYVALAENFSAALILNVNGTNVASPSTGIIPGSSSNAMIRKGIHGAFSDVRFTFPASLLQAGANQISFTLRVTGGATSGEVMYDYVRLEADGTALSSVTLPVAFSSVKAFQQAQGVQVEWTASTESSILHYEVEKQSGQAFNTRELIAAKGSNGAPVSYQWFDAAPATGANYYRIKAVDYSGAVHYSSVVKAMLSGSKPGVVIYPSPLTGNCFNLQLNNLPKGVYRLTVVNSAGQLVLAKNIQHNGGSATEMVETKQHWAKGIYRVEICGADFCETRLEVKN